MNNVYIENSRSIGKQLNIIEHEFLRIRNIVKYCNKEITIAEMPDDIRNMTDAFKAIEEWNVQIQEKKALYNKTLNRDIISPSPFDRFQIKFIDKK